MTAEAPADEVRLVDPERVQDRANRAGMAGKRIGARILRVVRRAVTRKIDRDQPEALAKRPIELPRKGARGRRIAVDEHHGWTLASRFVNGDCAIRRVDFPGLHRPPPNEKLKRFNRDGRVSRLKLAAQPLPKVGSKSKTCNIHKCLSRTGRVGPSDPPRTLPPIERRVHVSPMICPEINGPVAYRIRLGAFRNGQVCWRREGADNFARACLPAHRRLPVAACCAWGTLAGHALELCLDGRRSALAHRAGRALAELSCAHSRRASPCPLGRLAVWAWGRSRNHHAAAALHQRTCLVDRPPQRRRVLGSSPDALRRPFPFADLSCIAPHNQSAEHCYVWLAVVFPSSHSRRQRPRLARFERLSPVKPAHEASQHRHHRPRRPWQDDPRRPALAAVGRVSRQPARRRTGHGFERPRTRARHHHPRQGNLGGVEGRSDQYRRHAGPRRFRRRGRAHPFYGRRGDHPGGCGRRPDAADQVRPGQGAENRAEADRLRQQSRQAGRSSDRSRQRSVRPVRRARRDRRTARFPDHLWLRQAGLDVGFARRAEDRHGGLVRPGAEACGAAEGRRGRFSHARHALGEQPLPWPHRHRPRVLRLDQDQHAGKSAGPRGRSCRGGPGLEDPRLPRHRAGADRRGGRRRHYRDRGAWRNSTSPTRS